MSFAEAIVTNDIVRVGRVQNVQTRMAIPSALLNRATASPQKYDVVLSFSGDDRAYVDEVAAGLKKLGVRVFYDRYEEASRWGKDLVEHFDSVYRNDGRYCVMFISKSYAEKMWTRSRAVERRREYILPARFDDAVVDGLRPTTAYVDLRRASPPELVELIATKLAGFRP
jgi:hypothetical protein